MELALPGDTPPKQDWSKQVDKAVFAGRFAAWKWELAGPAHADRKR